MLFAFSASAMMQLVINSLAVLGSFLAGYLIAGFIANLLDRFVFHRKAPLLLHRMIRWCGGVALAFLVAAVLFGHGAGWNLLGGGDTSQGGGQESKSQELINTAEPSPSSQESNDNSQLNPAQIRITILGGNDVQAQRFYLIGEDTTPRTLSEVKEIVLKHKKPDATPPVVELQFSKQNVLPGDHPAVILLVRWLRGEANLRVVLPAENRS